MGMEHWTEACNPCYVPKVISGLCCVICFIMVVGTIALGIGLYNGVIDEGDKTASDYAFIIFAYGFIISFALFLVVASVRLIWFCATRRRLERVPSV